MDRIVCCTLGRRFLENVLALVLTDERLAEDLDGSIWGKPNTRVTSRKVGTVRCAKWDYCEIRHR